MLNGARKSVYDILIASRAPLSAYEILSRLSSHGIHGPPTVYRALAKLIREGFVHRIESLNAFIACCQSGKHRAQFAICYGCSKVEELHETGLSRILRRWSTQNGFRLEQEIIEIKGVCQACQTVGQ